MKFGMATSRPWNFIPTFNSDQQRDNNSKTQRSEGPFIQKNCYQDISGRKHKLSRDQEINPTLCWPSGHGDAAHGHQNGLGVASAATKTEPREPPSLNLRDHIAAASLQHPSCNDQKQHVRGVFQLF